MTTVQAELKRLDKRRYDAALFGGIVGGAVGLILSFDIAVTLFAGVAGSLVIWYFASLSYWEYRDVVTLDRRKK